MAGDEAAEEVYPRVCGGTKVSTRKWPSGHGLSPRVRGNLLRPSLSTGTSRSIPACAGEPGNDPRGPTFGRVYPRVCGGTGAAGVPLGAVQGLSPRVRGNPELKGRGEVVGGSIPACAGEPGCIRSRRDYQWVYPRVCGGTCPRSFWPAAGMGLSPRVRGNQQCGGGYAGHRWSIPACAGEPRCNNSSSLPDAVYPRVCGGTAFGAWQCQCIIGLSPRVRGNPGCDCRQSPA